MPVPPYALMVSKPPSQKDVSPSHKVTVTSAASSVGQFMQQQQPGNGVPSLLPPTGQGSAKSWLPVPDPSAFPATQPSDKKRNIRDDSSDDDEKDSSSMGQKLKQSGSPFRQRLQAARVGNDDLVDRSLQKVIRAMKQEDPHTGLKPTALGGSSFTLIGNTTVGHVLSPERLKAQNLDARAPVGLVLKWVPCQDVSNEIACTNLSELYGLEAPTMTRVSPKTSSLFVSPTKQARPAFSPEPFELLIMNRFRGMNLQELCKKGVVFTLSADAWQKMMRAFRFAAPFDLCIGNFDRFIRIQTTSDGRYILAPVPQANPGNVMVEASPQKGSSLVGMAFIDNANPLISGDKQKPQSSGLSDFALTLFDDDSKAAETDSHAAAAASSTFRTPPNSPPRPKKSVVPGLHTTFVELMHLMQTKPKVLSSHIVHSVFNALTFTLIDEMDLDKDDERLAILSEYIFATEDEVLAGVLTGYKRLFHPSFVEGAHKIALTASTDLKALLQLNLAEIARLQQQDEI